MSKKKPFILLAVGMAGSFLAYKIYQAYKKQQDVDRKKEIAEENFRRGNFKISLFQFKEIQNSFKSQEKEDIDFIILKILLKLKKYEECLKEIHKMNYENEKTLLTELECYKQIDDYVKVEKVFFKICKIDKTFPQKNKTLLKNMTIHICRKKMMKKFLPKDIFLKEMYQMLPSFTEKLYSMNVKRIFESEKENNKYEVFIVAMIENLKENYEKAYELVKNEKYIYSSLLKEHILSQKESYEPSNNFLNIIKNSSDPTVILFAAIIFNRISDKRQYDFIEKGLKTSIYYFFQTIKIQNIFQDLPVDLAEKKIYKMLNENDLNENIEIPLKTCITLFLGSDFIEYSRKYIKMLEKRCSKSDFILIYKGMLSEKINDTQTEKIYIQALEKNPDMYEANLRYGSFLMNKSDESFVKYIKVAYDNSSTFREAYYAKNILLGFELFKQKSK